MTHSLKKILVRNTGVQLAAQAVNLGAGFALTYVLSRYLGVRGFGEYNYIFAFFFIFVAVNDFGIVNIMVREASKDKEKLNEMFSTVLIFKAAAAGVLTVFAWGAIAAMHFPPALQSAMNLYALSLPVMALELPLAVFQIHLNLVYPAAMTIVFRLANLALVLLAAALHGGLKSIVAASLAAEMLFAAMLFFFSRPFVRFSLSFDKDFLIRLLKPGLVVWGSGILVAIIKRADFLMLERMTDLTQVGLYAAANRLPGLFEILPLMIMTTLFPVMSVRVKEDLAGLKRLYRKITAGMAALAVIICAAVMTFSPRIVLLIFGRDFAASAPALSALIVSTGVIYVSIAGGNLLISAGWEKLAFVLQFLTAAVNIGLNLLWLPRYGFLGAAWATTLASVLSAVSVMAAVEIFFRRQMRGESA